MRDAQREDALVVAARAHSAWERCAWVAGVDAFIATTILAKGVQALALHDHSVAGGACVLEGSRSGNFGS
jgi:hypothetical protein